MRRTPDEVKAELARRQECYIAKRQKTKKLLINTALCLLIAIATVSAVWLMPDTEDYGGIVLDGSNPISTPFDQSSHSEQASIDHVSSMDQSVVSQENVSSTDESLPNDSSSQTPPQTDPSADVPPQTDPSEDVPQTDPSTDVPPQTDLSVDVPPQTDPSEDVPQTDPSEDVPQTDPSTDVPPQTESTDEPPSTQDPSSKEDISDISKEEDLNLDMIYPPLPSDGSSLDLLKVLSSTFVEGSPVNYSFSAAYAEFAASFFKGCALGSENTLVSPLSMMMALAMTANGAVGDTADAMENALGGFSIEQLNRYLHDYIEGLAGEGKDALGITNSIWIKDGFGVNKNFLQSVLDFYGADSFMSPFTNKTVDEVNAWIAENTDGQIKEMLSDLPGEARLLLINALRFEAEWQNRFSTARLEKDSPFTNANGTVTNVDYMNGWDKNGKFIENNLATGFIKDYKDNYSFVALLPKDEDGLEELISSLTGANIRSLLTGYRQVELDYAIPRFAFGCSVSDTVIKNTLTDMGMGMIFDKDKADFRAIHPEDVYIYKILQDTSIRVDCKGTKASAATIVIAAPPSTPPSITEPEQKAVILNRPFVYMIVDSEFNIPVFMGAVTDMSKNQYEKDAADPITTPLSQYRDYEKVTTSDGIFTDSNTTLYPQTTPGKPTGNPTQPEDKTPTVDSITVIRSEAELDEWLAKYRNTDLYAKLYKLKTECADDFFYYNALVLAQVSEPEKKISYRFNDAYCYSDSEDELSLVLEYERYQDENGASKSTFHVFALIINSEIMDQIDTVRVEISQ